MLKGVNTSKYLFKIAKGTRSQGLEYSPENESNFRALYSKVAAKGGHKSPDTVAFSDADFAGCAVTLRSTSGSVLYRKGSPMAWSAKRQTVRATSTCESEYVAIYDCIKLSLAQGYFGWYLAEEQIALLFTDNISAINLASSTVVTKRSNYMQLRYHMVRDHCKDLCHVGTDFNRAD